MISSEKNYQLGNCNLIMFHFEEKLSAEIVVNSGSQISNQVKKPWRFPEPSDLQGWNTTSFYNQLGSSIIVKIIQAFADHSLTTIHK